MVSGRNKRHIIANHSNKIKFSYVYITLSRFFLYLYSPFSFFASSFVNKSYPSGESVYRFRSLTRTFRPFFLFLSLAGATLKWHFFYGKRKAAHVKVNENLKMSEEERKGRKEKIEGNLRKKKGTERFPILSIPFYSLGLLYCWSDD